MQLWCPTGFLSEARASGLGLQPYTTLTVRSYKIFFLSVRLLRNLLDNSAMENLIGIFFFFLHFASILPSFIQGATF